MTSAVPASRDRLRFGDFVLDLAAYELRRDGRVIRLERQPMDLLILLVTRPGELVSRGEIVEALWGPGVFVDVETGVHTAIRKIRRALHDSPDAPAFIETVPAKGYRFVAPISREPETAAVDTPPAAAVPAERPTPPRPPPSSPSADPIAGRQRPTARLAPYALALAVVVVVATVGAWAWHRSWAPSQEVTLAVLPFDNLSGRPDMEYLASGLAEELTVVLSQLDPEHLHVVGRTSMLTYRHSNKSPAQIGREVGAAYVVDSSVQAEGGQVRITAALVRTTTQVQVWADSYNREPSSIMNLQQELSSAIAGQIRLRLSPDRVIAIARRQTRNAEAYDAYLRGRDFADQRTPETSRRAIESFRRATALDPDYALAWSALSIVNAASTLNGDADPLVVGPFARQAAAAAIAADPTLAESQIALGYSQWTLGWDWPDAERALRRAVALDPQSVQAHIVLGHLLSQLGRHAEAAQLLGRARELDPLSTLAFALSSQVAYQRRDFASSLDYGRRTTLINPQLWIGYAMMAQADEGLGRTKDALETLDVATRLSGQNSKTVALRGYILARAGRAADARVQLGTLEAAARQRYIPASGIALVYAGLGERDTAFAWLEKAYTAHDVSLMYLPVDAKWDAYRNDARFTALIDRCGFLRVRPH
jgi:TolB-like protein/DNA-binding winged helix-turn-helix (wHTH) protein/Flp pilus assembly protein TadD